MKAKEYLQQLRKLDTVIQQKKTELANLRETLTSVSSPKISEEKVSGDNLGGAGFEDTIANIDELEQEITWELGKFVALKHKIINEIHTLDNGVYIQLLYKRYIEFKSLEQIAVEVNYSYSHIKKMHGWALLQFGNSIKDIVN